MTPPDREAPVNSNPLFHQPEPDSSVLELVRPTQAWVGLTLFCTTRAGGIGSPPYDTLNLGLGAGDDPRVVAVNRARLRSALPAEPFWLRQVHGTAVADADATSPANDPVRSADPPDPPQADAAVTTAPRRVLAVLTADCLPVVLGDIDGKVLGVAHAGWRGLAGGVLETTFAAMQQRLPNARGWRAWIGPGIGATVFQVGDEVRQSFAHAGSDAPGMFVADPAAPGKWLADLAGLAYWRLLRMGVSQIESSRLCTVTDPGHRFFSYRRDGRCGRMATVAWLHGGSAGDPRP